VRDDGERLRDILEAIERIERHQAQGREAFSTSELVQTWIVHHLQIIGEAARKLSDGLRKRHPEIPWPEIVAMRNVLVHDYFTVDLEEVWAAVEQDLPELKRKIEAVLKDLEESV